MIWEFLVDTFFSAFTWGCSYMIPYLFEKTPRLQLISSPDKCGVYSRAASINFIHHCITTIPRARSSQQGNDQPGRRNVVRGHHIYKAIWTPLLGEILTAVSSTHTISISSTSGNAAFLPAPSSRFFFDGSCSSASLCFFHSRTRFSSTL